MESTVERIGIILTAIWLCVVAALVYIKWDDAASMSLNEWGDFLAGMVAPLAFLWLIVGYMLQRQELRLNTEVLNLTRQEIQRQAEEMAKQTHFQEIQAQAAKRQISELSRQAGIRALGENFINNR